MAHALAEVDRWMASQAGAGPIALAPAPARDGEVRQRALVVLPEGPESRVPTGIWSHGDEDLRIAGHWGWCGDKVEVLPLKHWFGAYPLEQLALPARIPNFLDARGEIAVGLDEVDPPPPEERTLVWAVVERGP